VANFKKLLDSKTSATASVTTEYRGSEHPAMQACDRYCGMWAKAKGAERAHFMESLTKCLDRIGDGKPALPP